MQQNSSITRKGDAAMQFQRLEDLRVDADKTQAEIADVLSCKREVYRRYEKGIREIPVWALIKLAQYYQTSTDYILGLSNQRNPR
jgi:transcriptional regulator with XRE-family HTH domain